MPVKRHMGVKQAAWSCDPLPLFSANSYSLSENPEQQVEEYKQKLNTEVWYALFVVTGHVVGTQTEGCD